MPSANDLDHQLQTSTKQHPYGGENFWLDRYKYVDAEEFYALGNLFFRNLLAGEGDTSITMDQFMKRFDQLEKEQKALQQQVNHMSRDILAQLGSIQQQLGVKPATTANASGDTRVKTTSTSESNVQQKSQSQSQSQQQQQQQQKQQTAGKKDEKKEDDDDVDLFGDDDEEESEEAARVKAERVAAYAAKKSTKPTLIAKSNIILDVKPWDDETDMKQLEEAVRSVQMDGLLWGVSKLVPLAYGIKKLQITCVVEDEKVSIEELSEKLQEFEDFVQSVDIAAFNKI